ncbi:MAG: hypothetical protein AB7G24_00710 [Novosphingobium sp.]
MTFLITLFARWGLPERIRAPLATAATIVAAVALVLGAWNVWLHFHDRAVVAADRKAAQAAAAKAALDAERAANRADAARQDQIRANDATTRKAIDDAVAKDPAGTARPAGAASRAAADSLRNRTPGDRPAAR